MFLLCKLYSSFASCLHLPIDFDKKKKKSRTTFLIDFFFFFFVIRGLPSQSLSGTLSPGIGNLSNLQSV